jgi:molybdate transport system substrate-binding protein
VNHFVRRSLAWLSVLAVAGGTVAGFVMNKGNPTDAKTDVTLTVSAAADLMPAFEELGSLFKAQTGITVDFNFGSTGQLTQQIEAGAPVDILAAANSSYIDQLAGRDLIVPDTKKLYARGRIVLWTRPDSPLTVDDVHDLTDPAIKRIAIANPDHAPYGVAAREAMQSAGVWDAVRDKLVLGENVADTLRYATTGNVDVAIVSLSLIIQETGHWTLIPEDLYAPLDQALAVIAGTRHEPEARAFAAFVNGEEGRAIMRRYGFLLPGETVPVGAQTAGTPITTPAA